MFVDGQILLVIVRVVVKDAANLELLALKMRYRYSGMCKSWRGRVSLAVGSLEISEQQQQS